MRLFMLAGLPGCGKTTIANEIARKYSIPLLSRDHIQSFLFKRGMIEESTIDGYIWILEQANIQLNLGVSCVLDAVFPGQEFREMAEAIAIKYQASFHPIYCYCSDRELWRARWHSRAESNDPAHWMDFVWEDVERIERQYEAWNHEKLILLDSIDSLKINFQKLTHIISGE